MGWWGGDGEEQVANPACESRQDFPTIELLVLGSDVTGTIRSADMYRAGVWIHDPNQFNAGGKILQNLCFNFVSGIRWRDDFGGKVRGNVDVCFRNAFPRQPTASNERGIGTSQSVGRTKAAIGCFAVKYPSGRMLSNEVPDKTDHLSGDKTGMCPHKLPLHQMPIDQFEVRGIAHRHELIGSQSFCGNDSHGSLRLSYDTYGYFS